MTKKVLAVFVLVPLLLVMTGTLFVSSGWANPNWRPWEYEPPYDVEPPVITIVSPENNSVCSPNNLLLTFNVTVGESETPSPPWIYDVYYKGDWQQQQHYVYSYVYPDNRTRLIEFSANLNELSEGNHSIIVSATEDGEYSPANGFGIVTFSIVCFTVDATPPSVSVAPMNKTYETSDVSVNFTVNELVSQIKYSLDEQENITIVGNTTLTALSSGEHSIRVYAIDVAGNTGASEQIAFTVNKETDPLSTIFEPAAGILAIVGVTLVAAVFRNSRKKLE